MRLSWNEIIISVLSGLIIATSTYFLVTEDGHADDYMTGGVGVFNSAKKSHSESKLLNVGHREPMALGLIYQYEVGGWADIAKQGRKSSGYGALQVGVQTDGPIFARVMAGPAIITTPDAYLGGMAQMAEDLYLGLKGSNGNSIGLKYKHFSSAGLEQPNVGRDFVNIEASIPW